MMPSTGAGAKQTLPPGLEFARSTSVRTTYGSVTATVAFEPSAAVATSSK
jgi:hypothetical protein